MKHTILICGYGPGISQAVAHRFGGEISALAQARNVSVIDTIASPRSSKDQDAREIYED